MPDRLITLCYRKVIDATATRPWDKLVLDASYQEFRLQAQRFNPNQQYRTFGQLLHQAPGAEQLHFLVSGAITGYVQQLHGLAPDIVDNLGRYFLRFARYQFEIINSDLLDPARHQVGISFFSAPLRWHETLGPYLLVSDPVMAGADPAAAVATTLFQLQPYLSIHSLQQPAPIE